MSVVMDVWMNVILLYAQAHAVIIPNVENNPPLREASA